MFIMGCPGGKIIMAAVSVERSIHTTLDTDWTLLIAKTGLKAHFRAEL